MALAVVHANQFEPFLTGHRSGVDRLDDLIRDGTESELYGLEHLVDQPEVLVEAGNTPQVADVLRRLRAKLQAALDREPRVVLARTVGDVVPEIDETQVCVLHVLV